MLATLILAAAALAVALVVGAALDTRNPTRPSICLSCP